MKRWLLLCLPVFFLSACQKKRLSNSFGGISRKKDSEKNQEIIARLSDIPDSPFSIVLEKAKYSVQRPDQYELWYNTRAMSYEHIKSYYAVQMELLGWKLQGLYDGIDDQEDAYVFVKPNGSWCLLSLRGNGQMVLTILKK